MSAHQHSGFVDAMRRFGIAPVEPVEPQPGKFARFSIAGDKPRERSGWAVLSDDGRVLRFGSHRTGIKGTWQDAAAPRPKLPPIERAAIAQRIAAQREQEAKVAEQVRAMWDKCRKADDWHPALRRLGLGLFPFGVRESGNAILVPMVDAQFKLWNLLMIYAVKGAPQRHPFKGGRRFGLFWAHALPIGDHDRHKPIVIADRYEAASAIHAPTSLPVVASMSTENLGEVARIVRQRFPARHIIIAAYDDRHQQEPARLRAAVIAANAIGAAVATPSPLNWLAIEGMGWERLEFGDIIERIAAARFVGGAA